MSVSEVVVYFKACPRCLGNLTLEKDVFGPLISRLACGYVTYPDAARGPAANVALASNDGTMRNGNDAVDAASRSRGPSRGRTAVLFPPS